VLFFVHNMVHPKSGRSLLLPYPLALLRYTGSPNVVSLFRRKNVSTLICSRWFEGDE
jgi:hypothetical protein